MKQGRLRLALVPLALLAPLALLGERSSPPLAHRLEAGLPVEVAGYRVLAESELEAEVVAVVRPDDYVLRRYGASSRPPIDLYVALYGTQRGLGAGKHDPRLCYPAQGWEVTHSGDTQLPLPDGNALNAIYLITERDGVRDQVLFWVQPSSRWPRSPALEQLLGLGDALSGRDQYAFVRISTPHAASAETDTQLREFASALAPSIRQLLQPTFAASAP
jgi:EpsI family protein